jgi:general secretion pathway protein A
MFAEYYGLSTMPFQLTPDNRFFFASSVHNRAISHLVYGLSQEEGFVVITGEVGAGKTTLVERLWSQLDRSRYVIARIVQTQVSGDDLLRLAAIGFGLQQEGDKSQLLQRLELLFREQQSSSRRCVLVVDEAQALPIPALEELRMLSNVSIDGRALLQTVLLGQPQLRSVLARPELDQFRQRILASFHLGPLNEDETHQYIMHRMKAAGWSGRPHWEPAALTAVYQHSDGIPRRINRLCSRVLLYGALEESDEITTATVEVTARELQQDLAASSTAPNHAAMYPETYAGSQSLVERVELLEQTVARRERTFQRLLQLLSSEAGR